MSPQDHARGRVVKEIEVPHPVRSRDIRVNVDARATLTLTLSAGLACLLGGCTSLDSYLDPSIIGRWEYTPTNVPVLTAEHAQQIIDGYRARWRIEEFHRTWKQGDCNVEDAQLRSFDAVVRWATVLAAVATRIERLKYLSRVTPDEPATIELVDEEIEALKLDQRRRGVTKKKRLPKMPTIGEATRWVAELGGWIGLRNGPPGSVTISRGLERLGYLVEGIALARGRSGLPT